MQVGNDRREQKSMGKSISFFFWGLFSRGLAKGLPK
jgi:hypothetical protein